MCGILAWVGPGPEALDQARLTRATHRLTHRGPDAFGTWSDGHAFLGHRRLKIIDLSDCGAQPMANEDGRVRVVFNGEIYNFPELRAELEAKGHAFRSRSDTEVIVHGYEEWGDGVVERLWGMFAIAVWDQAKRRLLAARDRFGKKPLNYVHRGDRLALASETPALLETGLSERRVDVEHLGLFWQLEFIPAPYSAFADIHKLPAGHAMVFEDGRLRTWRYYPPRRVEPFTGSYEEAKERLAALMDDAVRRRLVSDVPLGVALSGGIDSACVVAAARRVTSGRLVTLTVRPHLDHHAGDEGPWAAATAKAFGTEHHEIRPVPDFRESFEAIIRRLGEPFAIASAVPCYYLFEALKKLATVVVSGDGGDEIFAGYDHYRRVNGFDRARRFVPRPVAEAAYGVLDAVYAAAPAARPRLKQGMAGLQLLMGRPWTDARWELRQALRGDALRAWPDPEAARRVGAGLADLFDETEPMRRQMLSDQFNRMTYHILTKVDITSMSHAVEVRSPLLDHRVAEFARGLPADFLVRHGKGKWILRDTYAREIPPEVFNKPKTGFGLPIRELFAHELRPYLLEVLGAPHPVYDALVNRARIPGLIEAHRQGRPHQTTMLLKLLSLRLWIEQTRPNLPA